MFLFFILKIIIALFTKVHVFFSSSPPTNYRHTHIFTKCIIVDIITIIFQYKLQLQYNYNYNKYNYYNYNYKLYSSLLIFTQYFIRKKRNSFCWILIELQKIVLVKNLPKFSLNTKSVLMVFYSNFHLIHCLINNFVGKKFWKLMKVNSFFLYNLSSRNIIFSYFFQIKIISNKIEYFLH